MRRAGTRFTKTIQWLGSTRPEHALHLILRLESYWCEHSRRADACALLENLVGEAGLLELHGHDRCHKEAYNLFSQLVTKLPEKDMKVRPLAFANLGYSALRLERFQEAYECLDTAESLQQKSGGVGFAEAFILAGKACVRSAQGFSEQSAALFGSAELLWSDLAAPIARALRQFCEPIRQHLIEALGEAEFIELKQRGSLL